MNGPAHCPGVDAFCDGITFDPAGSNNSGDGRCYRHIDRDKNIAVRRKIKPDTLDG